MRPRFIAPRRAELQASAAPQRHAVVQGEEIVPGGADRKIGRDNERDTSQRCRPMLISSRRRPVSRICRSADADEIEECIRLIGFG